MQPTSEANRIESLDVLRGFALLGILLLNILGFGLVSAAYSNPAFDLPGGSSLDWVAWALVEMTSEGAMRCLFSMLFGAGVLLFATGSRAKSTALHYRRTFWLLLFGLFDAYILLWNGDILTTYALAGALLYLLRNLSAQKLLIISVVLLVLVSGYNGVVRMGLGFSHESAITLAAADDPATVAPEVREAAQVWDDFIKDYEPTSEMLTKELAARRGGYTEAFHWNVNQVNKMLFFVIPVFLFWDALVMMLFGMAFYKLGILQGDKTPSFYLRLMIGGFGAGLLINGYEVYGAVSSDLDIFHVFAQMQVTYHSGRLGMATGYIGLLLLIINRGFLSGLRNRLACVGRMALTNYLTHSLVCALIFTGAGLSMVGEMSRASLYGVVFAIWIAQLLYSPWWLKRFRFGPVEWLWRALTYGELPAFRRS